MNPAPRPRAEWPTARQPPAQPGGPVRVRGRFGWGALLASGIVGLLCGVGLVTVIALAAGGPRSPRTVTVPPSVASPSAVPSGSAIVPNVVGIRYDRAKVAIRRAGYSELRQGGGLLGVIDDTNWTVVAQSPPAGSPLSAGAPVRLSIERG